MPRTIDVARADPASPAARLCDGRARHQPRGGHRGRHRRDAAADRGGGAGRRVRLHHLAHLFAQDECRANWFPAISPRRTSCPASAAALGAAGSGAFGMNSDFVDETAEFAWMTRLSKETGRPVWFLLTDRVKDPERWRRLMGSVHQARAAGAHGHGAGGRAAGRDHPGRGGLVQPVLDPPELHPARNPAASGAPGASARPRGAAATALAKSRPNASSRACRRPGRTWSDAGIACT